MYIDSIMRRDLVTVSPKATLPEARELLDRRRIKHLLVVKDGKLAGLLSDRDLRQNWASPATALSAHELSYLLEKVTVGMIMVKRVVSAAPETTVERAAWIMQQHGISALPVVRDERPLGMVTSADVMGVLLDAIGMAEDSRRLSLFVDDRVGRLAAVTAALRDADVNIQSFFCYPVPGHRRVSQLVIRVPGDAGERAVQALEARGFAVMSGYAEDITPFLPPETPPEPCTLTPEPCALPPDP